MQTSFNVDAPSDEHLDELSSFISGMTPEAIGGLANFQGIKRDPKKFGCQLRPQKYPLPNRRKVVSPNNVVDLTLEEESNNGEILDVDYIPANMDNFYEALRHFPEKERQKIAVNHLGLRRDVLHMISDNVVEEEEDSDDDDMNMKFAPSRKYRAASCRPRCYCEAPRAYFKNYCQYCFGWIPMNYH